jgi:hypothetical protein
MKNFRTGLIFTFVALFTANFLYAEGLGGRFNVGATFGLMKGKVTNYETGYKLGYGGSAGYFLTDDIEFGLKVFATYYEETVLGLVWKNTDTFVVFKGRYYFNAHVKGLYGGANLGFLTRSLTYEGKENDGYGANSLAYGAELGYDFMIMDRLSIGANAFYMVGNKKVKEYEENNSTLTLTFKKITYHGLLAEVKFYF